ncbi:HTH_48 domain-containing protein [Trichonephila clavipes]|nr:HTH_48 domain-containing protein [Trichonephila clavipes]
MESIALKKVVAIHPGIAAEKKGLISSHGRCDPGKSCPMIRQKRALLSCIEIGPTVTRVSHGFPRFFLCVLKRVTPSNDVLSSFASDLDTTQRKHLQNFSKPTETVFCQRVKDFRCFKAFSEGRESIEDEPRSGRPSVSKTAANVVRVRDLVRSDRRLTIRMIGEELNLNHTIVHQILTNELKMRKICAKMVPKTLSH